MLKRLCNYFFPKPLLDPTKREFTNAELKSVHERYAKRYLIIFTLSRWLHFDHELGSDWTLIFLEPVKWLVELYKSLVNLITAFVTVLVVVILWLPVRFVFRTVFSSILHAGATDTKLMSDFVRKQWPKQLTEERSKAREANQWCLHFGVDEPNGFVRDFYTTAFDAPTKRSAEVEAEQRFKTWWRTKGLVIPNYRISTNQRDITIVIPTGCVSQ